MDQIETEETGLQTPTGLHWRQITRSISEAPSTASETVRCASISKWRFQTSPQQVQVLRKGWSWISFATVIMIINLILITDQINEYATIACTSLHLDHTTHFLVLYWSNSRSIAVIWRTCWWASKKQWLWFSILLYSKSCWCISFSRGNVQYLSLYW